MYKMEKSNLWVKNEEKKLITRFRLSGKHLTLITIIVIVSVSISLFIQES